MAEPGDGAPAGPGDASRRQIFRGKAVDLGLESVVLPNGHPTELEIVRHPGGAAAVALDGQGRVCLLRQYRHAAGGWLWELPAGKIEHREPPLDTARRELAEEAGVVARSWTGLGRMLSSPGIFTEVIHLYLATDLTATATATEPAEVIEVHWVPWADALARARDGDIEDAKTVVGLWRAEPALRRLTAP